VPTDSDLLVLRKNNDSQLARQGLPPMMDSSAHSQFRAFGYRQISARIGQAVAKAVMRLLGVHRFPLPPSVPRAGLAWNCPGPADSFAPPVPFT
jgi:hypothetical protein